MSGELKSVLEDGPIEGEPLVSVCVITYNHGKYIRQCLDGILMQKVNFPYEILIHDDASPDDTADIIREYWEKYPTVIKPILQTENQYSKIGFSVVRFNYDRAKAKYIAQCEGDDYWTDDGKMQMQVDFLEEHGEYVGTAHNVRVVDETNSDVGPKRNHYPLYPEHDYYYEDTERMLLPGQSASIVCRNIFENLSPEICDKYYSVPGIGDRKFIVLLTLHGKMHCFTEVMSVYRYITSSGTSWSAQKKDSSVLMFSYYIYMYQFVREEFEREWSIFSQLFLSLLGLMVRILRNPTRINSNYLKHIFAIIVKEWLCLCMMIRYTILHPSNFLRQIVWLARHRGTISAVN